MNWPPVSVVMPVRDEERHLARAVRAVLGQDYPGPLEVVLAVGPSRDRTEAIAASLALTDSRLRVVPNPSGTTPAALNAAVAAARCDVVVRADGHSMLPPDYVRIGVEELESTGADNVGGAMAPEGESAFEQAVARAMSSRLGVGASRFRTGGAAGPADSVYLGVFRRGALERVGGFDERYLRAQDWELNWRLRRSGGLVWFTPRLRVPYRPRSTLAGLARQQFTTGRWRRLLIRQHRQSVTLRYLAPSAALAGVVVGTGLGLGGVRLGWALPAGYAVLVTLGAAGTGRELPAGARAWLPAVLATMHLAYGAGFLVPAAAPVSASPPRPAPAPQASGGRADAPPAARARAHRVRTSWGPAPAPGPAPASARRGADSARGQP